MKKVFVYILFFIVCINNLSLYQLSKLPVFIEHFKEHHQRDEKVDITRFLSMHYWGKDVNDNDQDKDNQLPFKDFSAHSIQQFYFQGIRIYTLKTAVNYYKQSFPLTKDNFFPNPYLSSLYRPPRA